MARSSRARSEAVKAVKKTHKGTLLLGLLCLLIGAAIGVAAAWFMTKDDAFTLNGDKQVALALGGEYTEEGVTIVSFGRDISDKAVISGDTVDVNKEGVYQVVYTVKDLRWGNYQLVRTVTVGAAAEGGAQ